MHYGCLLSLSECLSELAVVKEAGLFLFCHRLKLFISLQSETLNTMLN